MKVLEPNNLRWEMLDKDDIVRDRYPNTITFEEYEQTERDNFGPEHTNKLKIFCQTTSNIIGKKIVVLYDLEYYLYIYIYNV